MTTIISGDTGISPVTASGTDASINGLTVGKGGGSQSRCTAVGASALSTNTASNYNTAIGAQALQYQTGALNTAVGDNAMVGVNGSSTGGWNTALGQSALYGLTTGNYNIAIGASSLVSNTTGSNNTAVGYQAGSGTTTDSSNTFIGYQCGSGITGGGNVMFGASTFSGYSGSNQVACKVGNGREAFYADINAGASFRQYSNSSTWAVTSDQRVKENIVEIKNGLEKIVALRPVAFDYITSKEHNIGFVAQEFQNVLPDQVKRVKARPEEAELVGEDEIYTIQQNLVPYLVDAVKQLKTIIDAQATEIAELKAKVG